ncbi:MAG: hypothetical protein JNK05_30205 [Myxococcales bacterium]|nr:hypothetical protein [Myxococcales bacterium]
MDVVSEVACRRCGELIAAGEAAVSRFSLDLALIPRMFYHPRCLLDVDPLMLRFSLDPSTEGTTSPGLEAITGAVRIVRSSRVYFEGRDELFAAVKQRVQQIERIEKEASEQRRRKVVEGGKKIRRKAEIAVDHRGRPRVGVLVAYAGRDALGGAVREETVLPDKTLRSSLREYAFIEPTKYAPLALPWQPNIGALFVAMAGAKLTHHALQRMLTWASYELPNPVLWIIGPSATERDATEQKLRALLDEAGFVGDEARSVCTEAFDESAAAAVGVVLDEALSIEMPDTVMVDPREKLLAMLEDVVREKRAGGYARALGLVTKRLRGMSPEMKARAADCAIACLGDKAAFSSAMELLVSQPHRRGVPELRAALSGLLQGSKVVTKDATAVWDLLAAWGDEGRFAVLADLVVREAKPSGRTPTLLEWLSACVDPAVGERLSAFAETLVEADPRRAKVLAIVARIARSKPESPPKPAKKKSAR